MDLSISPQSILEALLHTKESLIDFGLKKRSTLTASSFSILNTCAKLLQIYGEDFDDSLRIKATSELSRATPSMQSKLENWYADMNLLMNAIQYDILNPPEFSDIVSTNVHKFVTTGYIQRENITVTVLPTDNIQSSRTEARVAADYRKGEQSEVNCGSLTSDNVPDIPSPPVPSHNEGEQAENQSCEPIICDGLGDNVLVLHTQGAPEMPISNTIGTCDVTGNTLGSTEAVGATAAVPIEKQQQLYLVEQHNLVDQQIMAKHPDLVEQQALVVTVSGHVTAADIPPSPLPSYSPEIPISNGT